MANQDRRSQITDLVNQWEQIAGHVVTIPLWMVDEMAGMGTQSLYDVGQYMKNHISEAGQDDGAHPWDLAWAIAMPWAMYGLDHAQYQSMFNTADGVFAQMTGRPIDNWMFDHFLTQAGGQLTAGSMRQALLNDSGIMQTYGWLKFGLDFQQFQQQKIQMLQTLGGSDPNQISDQQALLQLQYSHRSAGSNVAVSAQPTLSQQEKKQVNVGVGQSEVR